jgi:hypothetical protein
MRHSLGDTTDATESRVQVVRWRTTRGSAECAPRKIVTLGARALEPVCGAIHDDLEDTQESFFGGSRLLAAAALVRRVKGCERRKPNREHDVRRQHESDWREYEVPVGARGD